MTELDPEATITTIDGINAFDSISRRAMLLGLNRVAGGDKHSRLCACSIQNPPLISGRTTLRQSTRFNKEKGGNRVAP